MKLDIIDVYEKVEEVYVGPKKTKNERVLVMEFVDLHAGGEEVHYIRLGSKAARQLRKLIKK